MKIKLLFAGLFVGILLLVSGCLQELQQPPSIEPRGFGMPLPNNVSEVPQKIKEIYLETLKDKPKAELSACIGKGGTYDEALMYSISESYGFSAWYAYYTIDGNLITNGSASDIQTYTVDGKPSFTSTKMPETKECKKISDLVIETFPILADEQEGDGVGMTTYYYVCEDKNNSSRIYRSTLCGIDTCWSNFYDKNGQLIEKGGETGGGTPSPYEIKTEVKNCKRTTEEYFESKVL